MYLVRDDEERSLLPLHLEDDGFQAGDDVQVALAPRVAVAQLVLLTRAVLLGEAGLHLDEPRTPGKHGRRREDKTLEKA